jgi:predicted proteasome-type protease
MRSNIAVGLPIDPILYGTGELTVRRQFRFAAGIHCWRPFAASGSKNFGKPFNGCRPLD